jgi:hypothetical protein
MRRFLAALLSVLGIASCAVAKSESPFKYENVVVAFESMRSTPSFDLSKPLTWGFFFTSNEPGLLQPVRSQLASDGYLFVRQSKDEDGLWWLEVSRTEVHSPESLHARNTELFAYASTLEGVAYDGWDVTRSPE